MNINRDYLIINDVKKSNITLGNGSMFFYITDKNTQNIFVNLVINISKNELIQKYANIENAEDYTLTMNIVKPSNTYKVVKGKLHDKENAIFEFDLKEDCCDEIGTYKCELLTKCNINDHEEITTSNKLTYKVKSSVLNDLDDIVEAPEYPLVIQLFDKLSDIEQYEEDRRANELVRQLAEEQRQAKHDELVSDVTDRITAMDDKMVDVENRVSTKEQAVDKLINDTKADIDEYKVAKDQEIDEYKSAKDTEINNAITAQDNKIEEAINAQNDRITVVENNVVAQNDKLDVLETKAATHEARITATEAKNTEQDDRLDIAENRLANIGNDITNTMQPIIDEHTSRLEAIEAIDVAQNNRLDAIEAKNQQQDDRLLDIEKVNKRQDMNLKCLFAESKNNMIDITEEGNSIYLQNSTTGYTLIDEIKGNTLVNCNKESDKELILNGNINTSGDNTVTLTEGVDGGKVDVALEGNTLVNVSKTKDSTAISKSYTVENSGNHVSLQGEYDGSCRPVITGNTLVNLMPNINTTDKYYTLKAPQNWWTSTYRTYGGKLKPSTKYTFIVDILEYTLTSGNAFHVSVDNANQNAFIEAVSVKSNGLYIFTLTTKSELTSNMLAPRQQIEKADEGHVKYRAVLLEGDYTNKPIPDYFEGLQSSFEDNLVTQEMVDNGEEVADNLGKYRVDYKSTREDGTVGNTKTLYLNSPLLEGDTIEEKDGGIYHVHRYEEVVLDSSDDEGWFLNKVYSPGGQYISYTSVGDAKPKSNSIIYCDTLKYIGESNERNDCIWVYNNRAFVIQNSTIGTLTEFKQWLQQNPLTVVYKLVIPIYELIEQSNLVIPSYANGHLDFNTAVPVEKVDFLPFSEELTYLYANTQYTVQFVSDAATTADITLGDTSLLAQSIVEGLNRMSITTPATLTDNKLIIDGVGGNISEVVVTDTDREFMYFEGMKSVGECEGNIEILSQNKNLFDGIFISGNVAPNGELAPYADRVVTPNYLKINPNVPLFIHGFDNIAYICYYDSDKNVIVRNTCAKYNRPLVNNVPSNAMYIRISIVECTDTSLPMMVEQGSSTEGYISHQSNTQQLTHEPLRAVGNVKDRYVLIDGKWYIERHFDEKVLDGTENCALDASTQLGDYFVVSTNGLPTIDKTLYVACDKLPAYYGSIYSKPTRGIYYVQKLKIKLLKSELPSVNIDNFKTWLSNNPIRVVYQLATPVYEPIDYNPFEVYSDTTHITTNSVIPTNMVVKNHGFNCLLKPSTTYTISSNLGLNTVTTPSTLTEDCLRFMDTDTSDVTTMKNVLVLEGDWTTKADLIPANFSGIESAFEQEYDTEKGKYKVNVKVANEDKTKENNIIFYLNEPLRGVDTAKDKVFIQDGKVVVERNCSSVTFDGSDDEIINLNADRGNLIEFMVSVSSIPNRPGVKYVATTLPNVEGLVEKIVCGYQVVYVQLQKARLQSADIAGFKQWLQANPITVVHELAEPVYEEVEYNDVKLFIESFKNSTLFYNSNVPVTSKLYYSYSVPIVDTVTQTASISDEQDQLIIDLATQVAVLEMMTM